jgi:hypothetical protein
MHIRESLPKGALGHNTILHIATDLTKYLTVQRILSLEEYVRAYRIVGILGVLWPKHAPIIDTAHQLTTRPSGVDPALEAATEVEETKPIKV